MSNSVALDDLREYDKKKVDSLNRGLDSNLYPVPKYTRRTLVNNLIIEAIISGIIYYYYDWILIKHRLLAPALLGSATATLAQSINQFAKKKLNYSRIFKFLVWGCINGSFTILWIDFLTTKTDSLYYRILWDQLIGVPCFQLVFNVLNTLWDTGEISQNAKALYVKSLKYSYCFWPFVSIVSFAFVPEPLIFPWNCLANLFWSMILTKVG